MGQSQQDVVWPDVAKHTAHLFIGYRGRTGKETLDLKWTGDRRRERSACGGVTELFTLILLVIHLVRRSSLDHAGHMAVDITMFHVDIANADQEELRQRLLLTCSPHSGVSPITCEIEGQGHDPRADP